MNEFAHHFIGLIYFLEALILWIKYFFSHFDANGKCFVNSLPLGGYIGTQLNNLLNLQNFVEPFLQIFNEIVVFFIGFLTIILRLEGRNQLIDKILATKQMIFLGLHVGQMIVNLTIKLVLLFTDVKMKVVKDGLHSLVLLFKLFNFTHFVYITKIDFINLKI